MLNKSMWHIHWKLSFSQNTWCRFYYKFTDSIFWSNGFFRSRLIWISTFARPGQILIQEEKSKRYSFVWESVEKINLKAGNKKNVFIIISLCWTKACAWKTTYSMLSTLGACWSVCLLCVFCAWLFGSLTQSSVWILT